MATSVVLLSAALGLLQVAPTAMSQVAAPADPTPAQLLRLDSSANPSVDFNHDKTGYHLDGMHATARCLGCHGQGILKGTPRTCSLCHVQGNRAGTVITQGNSHITVSVGTAGITCDACHTSQSSFRVWRMDHNATPLAAAGQCSVCHSGQSFEGVVPLTKPPSHPVTTSDCSVCHTSNVTFTLVSQFDHAGSQIFPGQHVCTNCHNGRQASGQPVGHIPIRPTECDYCHTSTVTFAGWRMDHADAGITVSTGGCTTCHNGQTFLNVVPVTKVSGHVPTTANCEACHTATDPVPGGFALVRATFNHATSGNPNAVDGSHGCPSCHNGTNATGRATGHVPTSAACDNCHKTTDPNFSVGVMNHSGISTGCNQCHTGQSFVGVTPVAQPPGTGHIPTAQDCYVCHTSTTTPNGFKTYTMNHLGIASGCVNCHNIGAPYVTVPPLVTLPASGHIPTSAACESCHTSTTVPNGFRTYSMSHNGIASGCAQCHFDGATYAYLPVSPPQIVSRTAPVAVTHIPTSAPCEWCHSSTTIPGGFRSWTMNHTGIAFGCNTCHGYSNGQTIGGQVFPGVVSQPASNHVPTPGQDCGACHTSTAPGGFAIAATSFDHVKAGVQPQTCTNCHNGTFATGQISGHIQTSPRSLTPAAQCDFCHNFNAGSFSVWKMNHTGLVASCASCHSSGMSFPGATTVTTPLNHFPIGSAACGPACHSTPGTVSSPGGGTGFATWKMSHATVSGTACSTCHTVGASWAGAVAVVTYPASGHIPVGATSLCGDCHTASDTPGSGGFKLISTSLHSNGTVAATACATCHNTGVSFMPSTPPLVTKPVGNAHIPIGAAPCGPACHNSTAITGGFATWTMDHTAVNTATCATCHGTSAQLFPSVLNQPTGHTVTGATDCSACHLLTASSGPLGGFANLKPGAGNPHVAGTGPQPVPAAGTCRTCHNGTIATGQIGGHMPTVAGVQCDVCHNSQAASFATWTMNSTTHGPANIPQTCSTCHAAGKTFPGATMVTQGSVTHIATLAAPQGECSVCHTATGFAVGGFQNWTTNFATLHGAVNTAQCSTCHGATAGSFQNSSATKIVTTTQNSAGGAVTHIAPITGDCSACHGSTGFAAGGFRTWSMSHAAANISSCSSCHGGAAFTNTAGTTIVTKTTSGTNHITTSGDCSVCHTNTNTGGFQNWSMASGHSTVSSTCATCHGATSAAFTNTIGTGIVGLLNTGTPANPRGYNASFTHIAITGDCGICHKSTVVPSGFQTWTMDHSAVNSVNQCATCHAVGRSFSGVSIFTPANAAGAHGPPLPSPTSQPDCNSCHINTTVPGGFAQASGAHTHVASDAGKCASCHTGNLVAGATNPPANHINYSGASCEACHTSYLSAGPPHFNLWTMNHSVVAGLSCSSCHVASTAWTTIAGTFATVSIVGFPTTHIALNSTGLTQCNLCHTNAKNVANTAIAASTATSGFAGQGAGWNMNHAGVSTTTCNSCHTGQVYSTGVTPRGKTAPVGGPGGHFATTPVNLDCVTCHSNTTTFSTGSMVHTGITAGCANCHGNGAAIAFANVTPVFKNNATHIATLAGRDCSNCHINTSTFTQWSMVHTGNVSTATCNNCHGGQAFATGVVPVAKPATHIVTALDCFNCHSNFTVPGGFAGMFSGWNMSHTGIVSNCASCHNGQTFATGVVPVSKPPTHVTTTLDCSICHTSTTVPGGFKTWTMVHTGIVNNCNSCHTGQTFATGVVPMQKSFVNHVPTSADCSNCHSSTTPGGFATWLNLSGKHSTTYMTSYSTTCTLCHGTTSQIYFGVDWQCDPAGPVGYAKTAKSISDHKCSTTPASNCKSCHNATDSKW